MNSPRWWLLAGVVPVAIACALASSDPALRPLGDLALVVTGLSATAILLVAGSRGADHRTGWRLLAAAPLFPVVGAVLAAVVDPQDPLELVVLRWVPTVPGYLLAVAGLLLLVDTASLRAGGLRLAVELAVFTTASLAVVQTIVLGPQRGWTDLRTEEQLILGAAVVVTSATMAAALTVLGVIEASRRRMALTLLVGAVALTAGRGLGTSALLSEASAVVDGSRFLVAAGLWLLCLAALMDMRPSGVGEATPAANRSAELGQLLPHVAMLIAVTVVGAVAASGSTPGLVAVTGAVLSVALAAVHRWVTARDERRMTELLQRSEAYFRSLVRSSGDAVLILDDGLRVTWASPTLDRVLGSAAGELSGRPLLEAVHPEDAPAVAAALPVTGDAAGPDAGAGPGATGLLLLRLRDAAGRWRYLEAGVSDLRHDPDVGAVVLNCRDMTERHAREESLQNVAYTDPVTGLPNRAGFQESLRELLETSGRNPTTVMLIAVGGGAAAREKVGREVVSAVVAELGRRLRSVARNEDVVARLGGDAFAVLADGSADDVDRLAARCHAAVDRPFMTPAGIIDLSAEIGLAELEQGSDAETVLARADRALAAAHASGPGSTARYGPVLEAAAARRQRLQADLDGAWGRGEFVLLLQPVLYLEEDRVTGVEASVRWRHPELGEVLPAEFVPIAESAGLLVECQRWMFEAAMAATTSLPSDGAPLRVGINLPSGYLRSGMLVSDVETALSATGFAPERLILEIAEDAVVSDDERIRLDLATLRLMGVHVALDSFGTGESALAHLTRLPIDVLKLDRSLISRLDRDQRSRAFCASIVGIGRALGLDVVAQGVETSAQLAALDGYGCRFAQGFLIARPMPVAEVGVMLAAGAVLRPGMAETR